MLYITTSELKSPVRFKKNKADYIESINNYIKETFNISFELDEIAELLLSVFRADDFSILQQKGSRTYVVEENVIHWIEEKLIPGTIILSLDDEDLLRLLVFSIQITYSMFSGETRATTTQKGFRERRRTFESILVDQFIGKLGEVVTKKFLENNFDVKIELDWEISPKIEKYRNDIINAKKKISIKTSPSLAGIWAEADIGYNYGISVKCSVPKAPMLQFFIEVCGFLKLLDFVSNKIPSTDERFQEYISEIRGRILDYKCGDIKTTIKGFLCGYFDTSEYSPVEEGVELPYLGKVREKRFLVSIDKLKYRKEDWQEFLKDVGLLS